VSGYGLLEGRTIVVTGVLTERSIAFAAAKAIQEQGGEVILTSLERVMTKTKRAARSLEKSPPVLEFDVQREDHVEQLRRELEEGWGVVHGAIHAIGFAPETCLGESFMTPSWSDVAIALEISTYSLKALASAVVPVMAEGSGIVALDFDSSRAWPSYNWMGVAKAGLEAVARYLARELGPRKIRTNLVCAGPQRTVSAASIPGFTMIPERWNDVAPLGWDVLDIEPVARACVALLSDWFPATTGEIVHVDGGFHAVAG